MRKARVGRATIGRHDDPFVQERIRHRDAGFEHAARVVAEVEHEAVQALRVLALERGDGPAHVICRGLAETGDAHVTKARVERGLRDAADFDLRAAEGEVQQLAGARTAHGELDVAARRTAQPGDGAGEIGADVVVVDLHDEIAGLHAGLVGGRALDGTQHLHRRVFGHHFDAHARVGAHGGQPDLFELVGVEVGGMRVERCDHAANRFFHELLVVDFIDVLALDALVDFGEQPRLFPGQRAGGAQSFVRTALGHDVAGYGAGKTKTPLPRRERSACAIASSFFTDPRYVRLEILQASVVGQRKLAER
ncbi:MAG: hypothetical protein WDO56_23470 [Gammaproteobacteria bacterium]